MTKNNLEVMLKEAEAAIDSGPDAGHYIKLNEDGQLTLVLSYKGKGSRSYTIRPGDADNPRQFVIDIARPASD